MVKVQSQLPRLALFPARGGSKRISRKNIRTLGGRPSIAWTIASTIESGLFSRILVSSEDEEIAGIARNAGAEVPFLSPAELGADAVPLREVIRHSLRH